MKVTVKEIAEKCGVGRSTVSFILANKSSQVGISQKLTDRVWAVAKELGYRNNALAKAVRTGKSKTIAYITTGLSSSHTMRGIAGISKYCTEASYDLKLISLENNPNIQEHIDFLVSNMITGVILAARDDIEVWEEELRKNGIKVVMTFEYHKETQITQVFSDDIQGSMLAVDEFVKNGHTDIRYAYVETYGKHSYSVKRHLGFEQRMQYHNLAYNRDNDLKFSENHAQNEYDLAMVRDAISSKNPPTAIFCTSDPVALRLMQYVQILGYKIPEDISIIGFANLFYSNFSYPALSTIAQPFEEIGYKACEILIIDIEKGYKGDKHIKLPVSYVERNSHKIDKH